MFRLACLLALLVCVPAVAQEPRAAFHYKPRDVSVGDVHPYFHNGECYLYYLHSPPKFEVRLAKSRDLLHWKEAPVSLEGVQPGDWTAPYFVLNIVRHPRTGLFHTFTDLPKSNGRYISFQSRDLHRWTVGPKETSIPPENYYARRYDASVAWDPDANEFGCVMAVTRKGEPDDKSGAFGFATSADLTDWKSHGLLFDPGNIGRPECPQMFKLGQHWYLLASVKTYGVGQPTYWRAKKPAGPWERKSRGELDGKDLCAAQVAFDGENRAVLFGWIPLVPTPPGGKQHWGGHLALPREVFALPDGSLATRLYPPAADRIAGKPIRGTGPLTVSERPAVMEGELDYFQLDTTLLLPDGCKEWAMTLDPLGTVVLDREKKLLSVRDPAGHPLRNLVVELPADKPVPLKLVCDGDIIELFLADRYTLAARMPKPPGPVRVAFRATGADVPMGPVKLSRLNLR